MRRTSQRPKKTIRQLREERGWSQRELAKRQGVDRSVVSTWERGVYRPRPRTWQRLADVVGVRVGEIAVGAGEERP